MYRNYIFDLYGTLADIRTNEEKPYLWRKMSEIYTACGAPYTSAELKRELRLLEREETKRLNADMSEDWAEPDFTEIFAALYRRRGVMCTSEQAKLTAITFRALSRKYIRLYDGAADLLSALRREGVHLYLLSNAQSVFTRPELAILGIDKCFDGIFISSEQGVKKPSSAFFRKLLDTYGLDPKESIMIGNDESADIAGANAVGMDSLYIHSNISPKEYGRVPSVYRVMDGDLFKVRKILLL